MTAWEAAGKIYKQGIKRLKKKGNLNKPCFIFSADYYVKLYRDILKEMSIDVIGILDNDPQKWGEYCGGLQILPVDSVIGKDVVILIASSLWRSMGSQLESMGLKEGKEFHYIGVRKKRKHFLSIFDLRICLYWYYKGIKISKNIHKKYGYDKIYYIAPFPSLGDLYIASLFLPNFIGVSSIEEANCVIIVTNKGCYKLAKALGYKYVELIKKRQKTQLVYTMSASKGKTDIQSIIYSAFPASRVFYLYCHPDITFSDVFYPYLFKTFTEKQITLPRFQPDLQRIERSFIENKLVDKKTVVIAPYAGSFKSNITLDMWKTLIMRLKQNGYYVCTNSAGKSEPPLQGTIAVSFSFEDSIAFLERAGGFLGIRSGICDIISSAKCTKVIMYETGMVHNSYNFFSLNRMGLCDDAKEYSYNGLNGDKYIDEIMQNFPHL